MVSGIDTESVVKAYVQSYIDKKDKIKQSQTKLTYKQDAWKELNTKLKNLQSKYLSNMRFTTAYSKKTTKVSNSSAVSVLTGDGAEIGINPLGHELLG